MPLQIVALDKRLHDRRGFDCGNEARNDYLQRLASQHAAKGVSRTFVLVDDEYPRRILGFYSLSAAQVDFEELPESLSARLPRVPIPAARLGQLGVHIDCQGRGHRALLIGNAVERVLVARESLGIHLLLVDAGSEAAADFYRHYGFSECNAEARVLFLTLGR